MSPAQALLAPLLLLLPTAAPVGNLEVAAEPAVSAADSFRADSAEQVRIERQTTIRVVPRGPALRRPDMFFDMDPMPSRLEERPMGKCLPISGIAGVQVSRDNRLLLFMRDHRIVSAGLERACRARDFYSGFYVERNGDGMICANRDALHSRSGTSCMVSRLRRLVESRD